MRKSSAALSWLLFLIWGPMAHAQGDAEAQRTLIDAQIARFPAETESQGRVFFLGFAGYGEQRVFAEEIKLVSRSVGEKYGSTARTVLLLNDRRDFTTYPFATASSLRYALNALAKVMDGDDVLFLALSSHGSDDATIEISNEGMKPQSLSADALAQMLSASGIRWKVIVKSACFSGTFIPPLADDHTIVLAAAAKNRTSFGCSDTRHLTYFGQAFYSEALPFATYLRVAFDAARKEIRRREKDEDFTPSQPQGYFGALMEAKLREIEKLRAPAAQ